MFRFSISYLVRATAAVAIISLFASCATQNGAGENLSSSSTKAAEPKCQKRPSVRPVTCDTLPSAVGTRIDEILSSELSSCEELSPPPSAGDWNTRVFKCPSTLWDADALAESIWPGGGWDPSNVVDFDTDVAFIPLGTLRLKVKTHKTSGEISLEAQLLLECFSDVDQAGIPRKACIQDFDLSRSGSAQTWDCEVPRRRGC